MKWTGKCSFNHVSKFLNASIFVGKHWQGAFKLLAVQMVSILWKLVYPHRRLEKWSRSMSMSLCKAQPDSMQENPILIALGKDDGCGGRGSVTTKRTWGRERGEGDDGITKLKTNVISLAAKRKQCLLLGEACLEACSRGWMQHCRLTLLLTVFCVLAKSTDAQSAQGTGWRWTLKKIIIPLSKCILPVPAGERAERFCF